MKQRFKKGDNVCYIDRSFPGHATIIVRMPRIRFGYIKDFRPGAYELYDGAIINEPFVYAREEEAIHEYITALLRYLKEVSEASDAVIAKLKEYGLEGFDIGERDGLDDMLYIREQVEHIRSIPEDKRTPEMKALLFAVDHPSVEDP